MKGSAYGGRKLVCMLRALLLCFFAGLFVFSPGSAKGAETAPDALCDLNGDGRISAADAAVLLRVLDEEAYLHTANENADPTQNGVVDETDARVILCMSAGRIPDLAAFAERVSSGLCDERFFDRFSYTGVRQAGFDYQSDSVSVAVTEHIYDESTVFVADIFLQDIRCFATAFASGKFEGRNAYTDVTASQNDAIIAMNGDYYSTNERGPIVRNGVWYRTKAQGDEDVCTLSYDGVLRVYTEGERKGVAVLGADLYQCWMFGPSLLDGEGNAKTEFNSNLTPRNPRTAIGYYEPGHYCFVLVDGRQKGYSRGVTLSSLSVFFAELGCEVAYNLDGGRTSMMATAESLVNQPSQDGRSVSDIVYIRALSEAERQE